MTISDPKKQEGKSIPPPPLILIRVNLPNISLIFVPIFLCLEHQLWKITVDRKLVNKSVGTDWIFGSNDWLIADGFVFNQQAEKVLDISGGASTGYLMTKRFSY